MQEKNQGRYEYPYIDIFRVIAALFVVAIHTAPFSSYSERADFFLTYCVGRIAVPFFLIVTGYFTLGKGAIEQGAGKVKKAALHLGGIYCLVTLLYLPVNYYSGNLPKTAGEAAKQIIFDGTFYHLWYLPGVILGMGLVFFMLRLLGKRNTFFVTLLLYVVGLFGDSYYGVAMKVPGLKEVYDVLFSFSSYTRNGIFFTPVFLSLGAWLGGSHYRASKDICKVGILVSMIGLLLEGEITTNLELQRHNSMYFSLIPLSFFLINVLLENKKQVKESSKISKCMLIREMSLWIYLLHPFCIIFIRGAAKAVDLKEILVDSSLVFYVLVCISSVCTALTVTFVFMLWKEKKKRRNQCGDGRYAGISGTE